MDDVWLARPDAGLIVAVRKAQIMRADARSRHLEPQGNLSGPNSNLTAQMGSFIGTWHPLIVLLLPST
jgi:hypothetical protein